MGNNVVEWIKSVFVGEEEDETENEPMIIDGDEKEEKERSSGKNAGGSGNIVSINLTVQLEVVLEKPESFSAQVSEIANNIRDRRAVVLNLESATRDEARRILDFIAGAAYALDGKVQRVSNATYLITPKNVGFVGEIVGELENNGVFFG